MTFESFMRTYINYRASHLSSPIIVNLNNMILPDNSSLHWYSLSDQTEYLLPDNLLIKNFKGNIKVKSLYKYPQGSLGQFKYNSTNGKNAVKKNKDLAKGIVFIKPNKNTPVLPKELLVYNYVPMNVANDFMSNPLNPYFKTVNTLTKIPELVNFPVTRNEFINITLPPVLPTYEELKKFSKKKMNSNTINNLTSNNYIGLIELWKMFEPSILEESPFSKINSLSTSKVTLIFNTGTRAVLIPFRLLFGIIKEYEDDARYSKDGTKLKAKEVRALLFNILTKLYEAELVGSETPVNVTNGDKLLKPTNVRPEIEVENDDRKDVDEIDSDISKIDIKEVTNANKKHDASKKEVIVEDEELTKADIEDISVDSIDTSNEPDITMESLLTETTDVPAMLQSKLDKMHDLDMITKNRYNKLSEALVEQRNIDIKIGGEVLNIGEVLDSVDDINITEEEAKITDTHVIKDKTILKDTIGVLDKKYITKQLKKDIIKTIFDIQKGDHIITDIETEENSNILGSTTTFKIKIESLDGNTTTVKQIVNNIEPNGTYMRSMNRYRMRKQRGDQPIRKLNHNTVGLNSNANKLFVFRSYFKKDDVGYWITKKLTAMYADELISSLVTLYKKVDNSDTKAPKHYEYFARGIKSFKFKSYVFNFDYKQRKDLIKDSLEDVESNGGVLIGTRSGNPIVMMPDNTVVQIKKEEDVSLGTIFEILDMDFDNAPMEYASIKIYRNVLPVVLLSAYYFGLEKLLKLYKADYSLIGKNASYDSSEYYAIKFRDEKLVIKRDNDVGDIMFGGLKPLEKYLKNIDFKELNRKVGFNILFSSLNLGTANNIVYINQIKSLETMFIDAVTERSLKEMKEPTTFRGLLVRAVELLRDDYYIHPNDLSGMMIKGYERMPGMLYNEINKAVNDQKNTSEFSKSKISLSPYAVSAKMQEDSTTVIVDDTNPIAALKQVEDVTYTGYGGRSKESMSKETRIMHKTDIGVFSEASKDSGDVGISAYMTANPKLKNTLGMTENVDVNVDGWSSLLSTSALIAPFGKNDDTKRLNFSNVQNSHITPIRNASIPYVRTSYDLVLGSRVDDKFVTVASGNGTVIEVTDKEIKVAYKGEDKTTTIETYKLLTWYSKEEGGSTFKHTLVPSVRKGTKLLKDHVIMYDDAFFAPDSYDKTRVAYKSGVNLLVGFVEDRETHEDSTALSKKTSELMSQDSIKVMSIEVESDKEIMDLVKVGDSVNPSMSVCKIMDTILANKDFDSETMNIIQNLQANAPSIKYEGVIDHIVVYYNCEIEDMSPSLKKLTLSSDKKLKETIGFTGQVDNSYSIKGKPLPKGNVQIKVYIKVDDDMGIADKAIFANQLKCTVGDIYDLVETEDGDEVDALFSTISVQARIVGSVPIMGRMGYIGKTLTEQAVEMYYE